MKEQNEYTKSLKKTIKFAKEQLALKYTREKEYEYLVMSLIERKPKTGVYEVKNKRHKDVLGQIKYYPAWRRYCFMPTCSAVYSKGCLEDINNFIDRLEFERKDGNYIL